MMERKETTSDYARIHMAGDIEIAKQVCRVYCYEVGLCVTITPELFIYTGGEESGFVVGLLNFPRFPSKHEQVFGHAEILAARLRKALCQHSYLIEGPDTTVWVSCRDENKAIIK